MRERINKYDFYNENFEQYFRNTIFSMSPEQSNNIPEALRIKMFLNKKSPGSSLSYNEKIYILSTAFNKSTFIVISDNELGIGQRELTMAVQAQKAEITNTELLKNERIKACFVLSDKNMITPFSYINHVYSTEIYQLINKIISDQVSMKDSFHKTSKKVMNGVLRLIRSYERNKKMIIVDFKLDVAELYALMYFSSGEKLGVDFYNGDFKYSYNANYRSMFNALTNLTKRGYLTRRGSARLPKYSLTAKGMDTINKIMERIVSLYTL